MQLRERHRATLKPAVEHLLNSLKMFPINIKFNFIHPRPMVIFQSHPRQFIQLIISPNHNRCPLIPLPHRHRRRPKPVTTEIPIRRLLNILLKSPLLQIPRKPVNILILSNHQLLLTLHIKEPARKCPVHYALLASWVKRILMLNIFNLPDNSCFFKALRNKLISCPNFNSPFIRIPYAYLMQFFCYLWQIIPVFVQHIHKIYLVHLRELIVVLTICWRNMH